MSQPDVTLTGFDGSNPLAFLAALGVLRTLDHRARQKGGPTPRMSWIDDGSWRPTLQGPASIEIIIEEVLEDRTTWEADPAFLLAYDETGEKLVNPRKAKGKFARDLKPKPTAMATTRSGSRNPGGIISDYPCSKLWSASE